MKKRNNITEKIRDGWIKTWNKANEAATIYESPYQAFIQTQDIKSDGAKERVPDYEIPFQERDLLSQNEVLMFFYLKYDLRITTIKEQYPLLDIPRAMALAKTMKIRYPRYRCTGVPVLMTSDFNCESILNENLIYSVKPLADLSEPRTKQKLDLEKAFWETIGYKHYVITDAFLKRTKFRNISNIAPHMCLEGNLTYFIDCWMTAFRNLTLTSPLTPLADLLEQAAQKVSIPYYDSVSLFNHNIWHREIDINLNKKLVLTNNVEESEIYV